MATKKHETELVEAAVVATLLSRKMTLSDIAHLTGRRKETVGKRRNLAIKHKFLLPNVLIRGAFGEDVAAECDKRLEELDCAKNLRKKSSIRKHQSFFVIYTADPAEFERRAAECIAKLITGSAKNHKIGVMWGGVIERVLGHLDTHFRERDPHGRPRNKKRLQCVPLCGEVTATPRESMPKYSSSYLAAELFRVLSNGDDHTGLDSLSGVPAYVADKGRRPLMKWIHSLPAHQQIFGPGGVANELDMIITGLGAFGRSKREDGLTGVFLRERIALEEPADRLIESKLKKAAVGDIGGWIVRRPGSDAPAGRLVARMNRGWTGVNEDHLKQCAERSDTSIHKKPKAGVVAVARGAHKCEIVRAALRGSARKGTKGQPLVNTVICDKSLYHELMKK